MPDQVEIYIDNNGAVSFIHDDDVMEALLPEASSVKTTRAAWVEPDEDSPGLWAIKLAGGGPSNYLSRIGSRRQALEIERKWVSQQLDLRRRYC
jgi:hypothetical protein